MSPSTLSRILALMAIGAAATASTVPAQLRIVDNVCDVDLATCTDGEQGLTGARDIIVSADTRHVYVVSWFDDSLLAFRRAPKTGKLTRIQSIFDGDVGIDGLNSPHELALSPDGRHLYVAAFKDSSLTAFSRSASTGLLTHVETEIDGVGANDGLAGAHGVAVSPDGEHVYVAARSEDKISAFSRDAATGAIDYLQDLKDNLAGVNGLSDVEDVTVSPDGRHVYAAGNTDNSVAVFARETDTSDPDFGELTFVEAQLDGFFGVDGLQYASAVDVSPDGLNVYAASERGSQQAIEGDDWAAVFARDPVTGALTFLQGLDEEDFGTLSSGIFENCTGVGNENSDIAVAPRGDFVYLTNPFFGTLAQFERHKNGRLTLARSICDLNSGADGLAGATGVTTTPDGYQILTANNAFESISVLQWSVFADGFESGDTSTWSSARP